MANDIVGVMDALGVKRAVLMGGSMGAALATRIAAQHPDRVDKLVLHLTCWTSNTQLSPAYLQRKIARKRAQFCLHFRFAQRRSHGDVRGFRGIHEALDVVLEK